MLKRSSSVLILTMLSISSWILPDLATAEDRDPSKFVIEALPEESARRVENERGMFRQFGFADPNKTSKGVVNALKIWTYKNDKIRVCFFGGSKQGRARVVKVAMEWKTAVPGLALDFGDIEDPPTCQPSSDVNHIRISFNQTGYWSHVGTDSVRLVGQDQPSMNLQGLDWRFNDEGEFRSTVLHEFGHAIGFNHEHQNPISVCKSEFNWPLIKNWLRGPPNNWSDATIEFNMGELHEQGLLTTTFDRASIMLYTFPPEYFINGRKANCYSDMNTRLSTGDIQLARGLYPVSLEEKKRVVAEIRDHYLKLINASDQAAGAKSGITQIVNQLLPDAR